MEPESSDYAKVLADLEAKKAALEAAIMSLRAAIAAGALGTVSDVSAGPPPTGGAGIGDIPRGAFLGKGIPEAIGLYLAAVRKKCTNSEIAQGLKKGGIESTSPKFENVVTNTLYRLKDQGKVLRFDDGWGLAAWYPEGFRSRVEQNNKGKAKRKRVKKKPSQLRERVKAASKTPIKMGEAPKRGGPQKHVEEHFSAHPGVEFSSKEIAQSLGLNVRAVTLIASKLAHKKWIEKTATGKFRRLGKVQEIAKDIYDER